MRPFIHTLFFSALFAVVAGGCQNQSGSSSQASGGKVYDVRGKIVAVDVEKKVVTLDHEDIPGFMKAMTMEFAVADAKVLDGLKAGDAVQGKIKTDGGSQTVTSLEKR